MSRRFLWSGPFLAAAVLASLALPTKSYARSVLSAAPSAAEARAAQVSILSTAYGGSRTVGYSQLSQLLPEVAGRPTLTKYAKYGGNFRAYWRAAEPSFLGKGFEAIIAHRENELRIAAGRPNRLIATAAEGLTHDAADLVEKAPDGTIVARYQAKLGARAAMDAIHDAKYSGMRVVTTPESLERIRTDVSRAELSAARRGINLDRYRQGVADSLRDGRLIDHIPNGVQAPTRRETGRIVRRWLIREWRSLARTLPGSQRSLEVIARPIVRLGQVLQANRLVTRGLLFVDVGTNVYLTYGDFGRFERGEIPGGYLAFKASLRTAQSGLGIYAACSPELATKGGAAIAAVTLLIIDLVSDPIYEAWNSSRNQATTRLLSILEDQERGLAVRQSLLAEAQGL